MPRAPQRRPQRNGTGWMRNASVLTPTACARKRIGRGLDAESARAAAEAQAQQARSVAEQSEREKAQLRDQLRAQLDTILETRETARGLVVNLSDVLFDFDSANLKPGAREKVARMAGILQSHPDLKIQVEGHTDSVGSDDYNLRLSDRRAESVRSSLVQQGIARDVVGTAGFGESKPVATNGTAAGRQQNRRVEIVVSGEVDRYRRYRAAVGLVTACGEPRLKSRRER